MPRLKGPEISPKDAIGQVFGAKVDVTEKDARSLKNLLPWRLAQDRRIMWSDNWPVFIVGVQFGVLLCVWVIFFSLLVFGV